MGLKKALEIEKDVWQQSVKIQLARLGKVFPRISSLIGCSGPHGGVRAKRRACLKFALGDFFFKMQAVFAHPVPYGHAIDAEDFGGSALIPARSPERIDQGLFFIGCFSVD